MHSKTDHIDGYTYGNQELIKSPVNLEELDRLKQTATLSDEDIRNLGR